LDFSFLANTTALFMNAAIQFVDRQRLYQVNTGSPGIPRSTSSLSADGHNAGGQTDLSLSTDVFWAMAAVVFKTTRRKEDSSRHEKAHKQVKRFLEAIQWTLNADTIRSRMSNNDDNIKDLKGREMLNYILMHSKDLSKDFVSTLDAAYRSGILNSEELVNSPLSLITYPDFSTFLRALHSHNSRGEVRLSVAPDPHHEFSTT
jgi:hypothetical protein